MKLIKFRVQNYKSIRDSGWCYMASDITILAGQNESGKSAILEAIRDFNEDVRTHDDSLRVDSDAKPVLEMCFEIDEGLRDKLDYETLGEEIWEYILEHGLTIIKYHETPYALEDNVNRLFAEQQNRSNEHLKEVQKILGDLSKIKKLSGIPIPTISRKDIAATHAEVVQYVSRIQPSFPNFSFDLLHREIEASIKVNQPNELLHKIKKHIPGFILFADRGVLPYEISFHTAKESFPPSVQDFIEITDLDMDEIINAPSSQKRRNILSAHSAKIPDDFLHCWKQGKLKLSVSPDAQNLVFDITESGNDSSFKPVQRSRGFQWFLSFYLHLKAKQGGKSIILIDEPGLYLHANAQKDVLEVLEKISEESQVIFSTHSPYLVDVQRLDRVRLVSKNDESGTRIENKIHKSALGAETLTPVLTAIGLNLSDSFSIPREKNVLVEGISDYYFLQAFRHCAKTSNISLIPGTGAPNIPQLVSLLIGWDLEFLVVLDNDAEGIKVAKKLKDKLMVEKNRMVFVSEGEECSIEDLFTREDFNEFVLEGTNANKNPEIKNSKFLKNENLDKVLLAKKFFEKTKKAEKEIELSDTTLDNFRQVFEKIDREFN